ncbi:hypothetical protein DXJ85_24185 [Vibrio parahaemolyticus]|nr:hypothetical protein DXJ85_24185 [Vibrio parahaemolyticus]
MIQRHNKAFKTDSQRLAASVQRYASVFMAYCLECSGSVAHHLTRRYVSWSGLRRASYLK